MQPLEHPAHAAEGTATSQHPALKAVGAVPVLSANSRASRRRRLPIASLASQRSIRPNTISTLLRSLLSCFSPSGALPLF
jgi:hypothetical protein